MFNIFKVDECGTIRPLTFKEFIFPAGEVSVKLNAHNYNYQALNFPHNILARIQSSDDLIKLAMLKDALQRFDNREVNLFLPYVPYARQDRVCDKGEAFSVMVFAKMIAGMGFNRVTIVDPHSEATPAAFEAAGIRLNVIKQIDILNHFINFIPVLIRSTLVSPDAGSNKKTAEAAGWLQHRNFIRADKLRDLSNGEIKEIVVYSDDINGRDVVILDDICEKGGTFIGLAKVLKAKGAGRIILYVTHGVFGGKTAYDGTVIKNLLANGIDEIWTTNSYHEKLDHPNLNVLDLMKCFSEKL